MADGEIQKYDSDATMTVHHARLVEDAKEFGGDAVKIRFVVSSRLDKDEDMWTDAVTSSYQTALAKNLKKGDVLTVEGFPTFQRWGDGGQKISMTLRFAKFHFPVTLIGILKEREGLKGAKIGATPSKATRDIAF
jgi:hypothetical protein